MREHGAGGAFSAIFIDVVELATIEPGVRADPAFGELLNFHVRLVCAHSPNSPAGVASAPFWGVFFVVETSSFIFLGYIS